MKSYEIFDFSDVGYHKLFHHQSWRIAILNYIDELTLENLEYVEAHHQTDEAFTLLSGCCTLVLAQVESHQIQSFECLKMSPHKVYKVPQGVYHTCILSKDAKVLIVEEDDTSDHNSSKLYLEPKHIRMIKAHILEDQS